MNKEPNKSNAEADKAVEKLINTADSQLAANPEVSKAPA